MGKLLGEIGHGSFGTVYKMRDSEGKEFAVKEVKNDEWSELEIDIQSNLCHPNIMPVNNVVKSIDNIFVVMPYCEYDVYNLINSFMVLDDQIKSYFTDVVKAVSYMHDNGVYHRDIKPENVMIFKGRAMLADFGLACKERYVSDKSGTSMYCAPEIMNGEEYDASKQDMWSLGLFLINLLCTEDAWKGVEDDKAYEEYEKNPKGFLKQLYPFSEEILEILLNLLSKDPQERMDADTLLDKFTKVACYVEDVPFHWDEGVETDSVDKFIVGSWDSAYGSSI